MVGLKTIQLLLLCRLLPSPLPCPVPCSCCAVALAAPLELAALGCASGRVLLVRLQPPLGAEGGGSAGAGAGPGGGVAGASSSGGAEQLGRAPSLGLSPFSFRQQQQHQLQLQSAASGGMPPAAAAAAAALGRHGCSEVVRSLHLEDWGAAPSRTGAAAGLAWSPDCRALAVGYARQGLAVWTVSGCRLMCTVRQHDAARTPRATQSGGGHAAAPAEPPSPAAGGGGGQLLDGGTQALAWGPLGYSLLVATTAPPPPPRRSASGSGGDGDGLGHGGSAHGGGGGGSALVEVAMAKALGANHRLAQAAPGGRGHRHGHGHGGAGGAGDEPEGELHVLKGADRLLLIADAAPAAAARPLWAREDDFGGPGGPGGSGAPGGGGGGGAGDGGNDLAVLHVPLPAGYVAANWPLVHAAVSPGGGDVAVSGRRGLAVYSRRGERWRLFGDVSQERRVAALSVGWLGGDVAVVSAPGADPAAAAAEPPSSGPAADASAGGAGGGGCQVLVFSKRHLDFGSLVASYDLKRVRP
jgi:hypothetical protein